MSQTLLTAATPYATILMSGVVSTIVTYYLNRNKEHAFFMRSKAEALYLAADEYGRDFGTNLIFRFPVTRGEYDYNKMLDLQQTNKPTKKHGGFETMTMLANIYFPEILPKLNALLKVRDRYAKFSGQHKQAYKEGLGEGEFWLKGFQDIGLDFDAAQKAFQTAIVASAKRYAARAPRGWDQNKSSPKG